MLELSAANGLNELDDPLALHFFVLEHGRETLLHVRWDRRHILNQLRRVVKPCRVLQPLPLLQFFRAGHIVKSLWPGAAGRLLCAYTLGTATLASGFFHFANSGA